MKAILLSAAAVMLLAACSRTDGGQSSVKEADGIGSVTASHCEIFVERAAPLVSTHGIRSMKLYLEASLDRLGEPVKRVGFRATVHDPENRCSETGPLVGSTGFNTACGEVGGWKDYEAQPFFGAPDYFELELQVSHDYTFEHRYEGAFFAETVSGRYFWVKAQDGGNFFVDLTTIRNLANVVAPGQDRIYEYPAQASLPTTADAYPYLNPGSCR